MSHYAQGISFSTTTVINLWGHRTDAVLLIDPKQELIVRMDNGDHLWRNQRVKHKEMLESGALIPDPNATFMDRGISADLFHKKMLLQG